MLKREPLSRFALLSRDAFVVGSGLFIGRTLGLVRELLLASAFGVSAEMDALVIALNIADLLAGILLGNAAAAVIIPPLAQLHERQRESEFWRLSIGLANLCCCALALLSLAAMVWADLLVRVLAPGLSHDAYELAVRFTRVTGGSLILVGMAAFLTPVLQARRRYWVPSLTSALQNLVLILFLLILVPVWGALSLAWGAVAGSALRLYACYWKARREGLRWAWSADWKDSQTLQIARRMFPAILAFSILEMNLLIDRNFASRLGEGSISALNFADRLVQAPLAVLAGAISLAALPRFAIHAGAEDWNALRRDLLSALGLLLVLAVPSSLLLMVLREPVLEIVFLRGAYDEAALAMTAPALFWYASALSFHGANLILVRVFHSRTDLRTPLIFGVAILSLHIVLNVICIARWDYVGIAISNAATAALQTLGLLFVLDRFTPLKLWGRAGARHPR